MAGKVPPLESRPALIRLSSLTLLLAIGPVCWAQSASADIKGDLGLFGLPFEEVLEIEIVSAARRPQPISRVASGIAWGVNAMNGVIDDSPKKANQNPPSK